MEVYYVDDQARQLHSAGPAYDNIYETLKTSFPWVNKEDYYALSEPIFHSVLQEDVITAYLPHTAVVNLFGPNAFIGARKFCMASKTSFLRKYELEDTQPSWLPDFCKVLVKGSNDQEYGRPYPPLASTFEDYYFGGNPEQVEAYFNLGVKRGAYETWYAATVVNGEVLRVKQYCYDEQQSFSDWDVLHMIQAKRLGRRDLI